MPGMQDANYRRAELFATQLAVRHGLTVIQPEVIALAVLTSGPNVVTKVLQSMGADLQDLRAEMEEAVKSQVPAEAPGAAHDKMSLSPQSKKAISLIPECQREMGDSDMGVQHLLLALMKASHAVGTAFSKRGVDQKSFLSAVKESVTSTPPKHAHPKELVGHGEGSPMDAEATTSSKASAAPDKELISKYCRNLNQEAADGKLDVVVGRDKEMARIVATLCRRKKNNPVLTGDPGVGKTAIVEGIAQRIVSGLVPKVMRSKKIMALDMTSVVGKTQYRGQFEEKMRAIVEAFRRDSDLILFMDEIHTIMGAGNSIGSLDAANIMKPALAGGQIRCIGATTDEEYKKYFSKDGALERRFQRVFVDEPSKKDTVAILEGVRRTLESHHGCVISDEALKAAVDLSGRHVQGRKFPDKAIDCLDEACAKRLCADDSSGQIVVGKDDIVSVISEQTGVSEDVIRSSDVQKIMRLKEHMSSKVVGQKTPVASIARVMKNAFAGVRNPDRPIASFVFGGRPSTGMSHVARTLAGVLFDSDAAMIEINLAEFTEKHHQSRLIGSPPGYVGFGERNQLTDRVLRHPYALVFLKGAEHAHPDVMKLFFQVLSRGHLTDSEGRDVSFKNTVVIMTMNMTSQSGNRVSGFDDSVASTSSAEKDALVAMCRDRFGDEFVNKVDEFVVFADLTEDDLERIAESMLSSLAGRMASNGVELDWSSDVPRKIVAMREPGEGANAKPVERVMQKVVESLVSDKVMEHPGEGCRISLKLDSKVGICAVRRRKKA